MMSVTENKSLLRNFECMVCQEFYDEHDHIPLALECGHVLCSVCRLKIAQSNFPKCPTCRESMGDANVNCPRIHQLIANEEMKNIFAKNEKASRAKKKLENDKSKKNYHASERNTISNEETDLEEKELSVNLMCRKDKNPFEFWCNSCSAALCKFCLESNHKHCDFELLETHFKKLSEEFATVYELSERKMNNLKKFGFKLKNRVQEVRKLNEELLSYQNLLNDDYTRKAELYMYMENELDILRKEEQRAMKCMKADCHDAKVKLLELSRKLIEKRKIIGEIGGNLHIPCSDLFSQIEYAKLLVQRQKAVQYPQTLSGFGYTFQDGRLTEISSSKPFTFVDQSHYEALGEAVTKYVYGLLESECGLHRMPVCVGEGELGSFIFVSPNWMECDRLMLLIHGSGAVRAGQWARSLIINDNLNSGTQIPYIKRALCEGYGVIVFNTNHNYECGQVIKGSENPYSHAATVWKQFVHESRAQFIAIVAHSYGGVVTNMLFENMKEEFVARVFAVAYTDSVHWIKNARKFEPLIDIAQNWAASSTPLDTPLDIHCLAADIRRVSAGVTQHEATSWCSLNSVFVYFESMYYNITEKHIELAGVEQYLSHPPYPPVAPDKAVENYVKEYHDLDSEEFSERSHGVYSSGKHYEDEGEAHCSKKSTLYLSKCHRVDHCEQKQCVCRVSKTKVKKAKQAKRHKIEDERGKECDESRSQKDKKSKKQRDNRSSVGAEALREADCKVASNCDEAEADEFAAISSSSEEFVTVKLHTDQELNLKKSDEAEHNKKKAKRSQNRDMNSVGEECVNKNFIDCSAQSKKPKKKNKSNATVKETNVKEGKDHSNTKELVRKNSTTNGASAEARKVDRTSSDEVL